MLGAGEVGREADLPRGLGKPGSQRQLPRVGALRAPGREPGAEATEGRSRESRRGWLAAHLEPPGGGTGRGPGLPRSLSPAVAPVPGAAPSELQSQPQRPRAPLGSHGMTTPSRHQLRSACARVGAGGQAAGTGANGGGAARAGGRLGGACTAPASSLSRGPTPACRPARAPQSRGRTAPPPPGRWPGASPKLSGAVRRASPLPGGARSAEAGPPGADDSAFTPGAPAVARLALV